MQEERGFFAAIDPAVTPELRREGLARELVSRVQRLRKESGFAVSDRDHALGRRSDGDSGSGRRHFEKWIADEVLARRVTVGERIEGTHATHTFDLDGSER